MLHVSLRIRRPNMRIDIELSYSIKSEREKLSTIIQEFCKVQSVSLIYFRHIFPTMEHRCPFYYMQRYACHTLVPPARKRTSGFLFGKNGAEVTELAVNLQEKAVLPS